MKYAAVLLGVLAILPISSSLASESRLTVATGAAPINFNILPGTQHTGQPVVRSFSYTLGQGAVLHDTVMIVNPSRTETLSVTLSASDAMTNAEGGGIAFNDSARQHFIGRWIQLGATTVTVPPYHLSYVPITVRLPSTTQPGLYEGAVSATNTRPQLLSAGNVAARVYLNRRCIVLLRVLGKATLGMRIEHAGVARGGAHRLIRFALHNTGTVLAYPTLVSVELQGTKKYVLRGMAGALAGGGTTSLAYPLAERIPPGAYSVYIGVQYIVAALDSTQQRLDVTWIGRMVLRD